ncbi:MAG: hypothetical protein IPF49_21300 [Gammaproteobacteria bacterium]|nr:hypothetical protein [Gammaproteobacteria bacterium]
MAAREIEGFGRQAAAWAEIPVVSYEELYGDLRFNIELCFLFSEPFPGIVRFFRGDRMGVTGSSELKKKAGSSVHWNTVEKSADFNPLERFATGRKPSASDLTGLPVRRKYCWAMKPVSQHTGLFYRLDNHLLDATFHIRVSPWYFKRNSKNSWPVEKEKCFLI